MSGGDGGPSQADSEAHVLAFNSGSSSLKFGLFRVSLPEARVVMSGEVDAIGTGRGRFVAFDADGSSLVREEGSTVDHRQAVTRIGALLDALDTPEPDVVGHRVVHGGPTLRHHCLIDDAVVATLDAAAVFAPLHTAPALDVIRFAREHFPALPHAACLDTAFHAGMPDVARVLPLPRELRDAGIERYGFHGLSCESILHQLGDPLPERLVIAHLGNGASVTAIKAGRSVDTSMGMTPNGGVVMGTRSGDLDPGVLLYLLREKHFDAAMLEELCDRRAGLLGVSGVSSDMRRLHEASASNADAKLAIDLFCHVVRKQIAAMIASLGGIDLLVFTGGIGEHDVAVRASICDGLRWAGVRLDDPSSGSADEVMGRVDVRVLRSLEEQQIARHSVGFAGARSA